MQNHLAHHSLFFFDLERKCCSDLRVQLNADLIIPETLPSVEYRLSNLAAAAPTSCPHAFLCVCMLCFAC
jgi:hypothetical protein